MSVNAFAVLLTQRSTSQREIVIHKLTPGDDHDSTGVIVEAFVRVHCPGYDPGQRQLITGNADTGRAHTIGEEGSDQSGTDR